jgi:CHAT domain-containing protein
LSANLTTKLMSAVSAEEFLRDYGESLDWRSLAELKSSVDYLVGADLREATRLVERIETLAPLLGDGASMGYAQASRARIMFTLGRHSEANTLYENGIDLIRAAGLPVEAAKIQTQQIDALKFLGRYDEAFKSARSARRYLAKAGPLELAKLETNLGNVYFHLDRYKEAIQHYNRAKELLSDVSDPTVHGLVDFCRSCVFIELDRPDEALRLLQDLVGAHEREGKALIGAQIRCQMAYLQYLRGNYNSALAGYYEARERLEQLGSAQDVAFYNLEIGEILLSLNAFDESAASAERAGTTFDELAMPYEAAKALQIGGLARMGMQEYDRAEADLLAARRHFEMCANRIFVALTDSYLADLAVRRGDASEAASRSGSARRVFSRLKLQSRSAHSRLQEAAAAYMSGDLSGSSKNARAALKSLEGIFAPGVSFKCHHLLGRVQRSAGRRGQALASFRKAIDIVEQIRGGIGSDDFKASFLADKIQAYEDAIGLCLEEGGERGLEEAFRLVELSKSRALADLLARYVREAEQRDEDRPGAEIRRRFSKLIENMNWYSSNVGLEDDKGEQRSAEAAERYSKGLARCEKQIAQLFRRMETEEFSFAEIQRMPSTTMKGLQEALAAGETAVEYFTSSDDVSAFVATREKVSLVRNLASKREVDERLGAFRFQIEKFNYGSRYVDAHFSQLKRGADEHLSALYEQLITPVLPFICGAEIILIPHGSLHYVPFHALHDSRGYLADQYEFSYAPSAAVLRLCRAKRRGSNGGKLVALGLADDHTPGINEELGVLGKVYPDSIRLYGPDATKASLIRHAPEARFIHLASHGSFRRDNPMFSFLKLADARLNFYSLLDLKLQAEMVTLSACRTGVNMIFPGDELHGLMRGFLYAGAPSLVVSLWAVSDRSTAEFMGEMYSRIAQGETKRKALRQAQLAIKDLYGHPYHWAPFVLMGDPG